MVKISKKLKEKLENLMILLIINLIRILCLVVEKEKYKQKMSLINKVWLDSQIKKS